jgi:PKD repeat protein
VTFSANRGTLSSSSALTDANGDATVHLTANADTQITATAGGKTSTATTVTAQPGPAVTLTCTAPSGGTCSTLNVGDVAVFTVSKGTSSSNIRTATLDMGDGTVIDLGNLSGSVSVSHQYSAAGTYSVALTATDVNGEVSSAKQVLIVQELAQVTLSLSQSGSLSQNNLTISATATTLGCTPQRFDWNFGNNANNQTFSTTDNSASSTYSAVGSKTVTVSMRCTDGRTAQTSGQLTL